MNQKTKQLLTIFEIAVLLQVIVCNADSTVPEQKTEEQCIGANEFWGCQSPTKECQRLCKNKDIGKDVICKPKCEPSCVCDAGYLQNEITGSCVYETECPSKEKTQRQARINAL